MRERGGVIGGLLLLVIGSIVLLAIVFTVCLGDDDDGMRAPGVEEAR